jgi:hypothetical protein
VRLVGRWRRRRVRRETDGYYRGFFDAVDTLSPTQLRALRAWERDHHLTGDWPGWETIIGRSQPL